MRLEVKPLNKDNFNDAVGLILEIMRGDKIPYKREEAVFFLQNHASTTFVLESDDMPIGLYSYTSNPNVYILNFLILSKIARKNRRGYALYKDFSKRLKDKPVIVIISSRNSNMLELVEKRGQFMGRYPDGAESTLEYYSLNFNNTGWKK